MKLKDTVSLCLIAAQLICNVNAAESNISTPTIDSLNKFGTTQVHVLRDCSFLVKNVSMGWYAEEGGYIFNATKTENAKGVNTKQTTPTPHHR
ncbi:hypothetical protein FHW67_004251 [Herbaspirillum sp. Sphag1AN]|uniref:hypothetical protein n=1 Tax=unclassified Herbaspirillum TaxID=2624150 RepID=UPI00161D34B9|nr:MULTISPECIES: hypothetical protein [unclassified Herbaspirillum]MBB3214925.1 hypothetical protein [Herbaspirillum sp. Sphag1AN]MBB3248119.1 hypothetical protein [Herbaspirillum sp. Sphag64]